MSSLPKRKRLEKKPEETPVFVAPEKTICSRCGTAYGTWKGNFSTSHSAMYRGIGHVPMCNKCVDTMFDQYVESLGSEREAMRRICMKMDLYWSDSIYDMVEKTSVKHSRVRTYVGKANLIRYIDKSFDDTIDEENKAGKRGEVARALPQTESAAPEEDEEPVDPEIVAFWGPGYTPAMYRELEQRRHYWMSRLPDGTNVDMGMEILIRNGCCLELDINRDRLAGKSIEKSVSALNTVLGSLKLKPDQQKDIGESEAERTPMGVWVARWEEKRPVPEPDPELQDFDGVVKYITTWFLGHLCKMLGIRNTYCKMYEDAMAEKKEEFGLDEDAVVDEDMFNDIFGNTAGDPL